MDFVKKNSKSFLDDAIEQALSVGKKGKQ